MVAHRRSMIAGEGWPWLIIAVVAGIFTYQAWGPVWAIPFAVLITGLILLFRDPTRDVPPLPLAILAPVDGRIIDTALVDDDVLPGRWRKIVIRPNHLGAYTIRAPMEGTILDVREQAREIGKDNCPSGLWLRTDEDVDIVLLFPARQGGFGPKTFVRYGERVGKGQRFAYLRLAPQAEIFLPEATEGRVATGDYVKAGSTVLADLIRD